MSNHQPLPVRLQAATYDSTCSNCGETITDGDLIGQFGRYEPYLCPSCTQEQLISYIRPDPIAEAIIQVREEARLRRLLDLDMGRVAIVFGEADQVIWTENPGADNHLLASVELVHDVLLITRPIHIEPYAVTEQ